MEDLYQYKLQLESMAHELEFVKKQNNVEATRRQLRDMQIRQVREELKQSEEQRLCLLQELGKYQKRVEELEAKPLKTKQVKSFGEPEIVTIDDDEDENYCEILEMSNNMASYLTAVEVEKASSDSGLSGCFDAMQNAPEHKSSSQEFQDEIGENGLALESMEETLPVEPSHEPLVEDDKKPHKMERVLPVEPQDNTAPHQVDKSSTNEKLKRLVSEESGSNLKVCPYCGVRPTDFKLHVRLRHKDNFTEWWSCCHCDKKYANGQSLKCHFESDHCNIRYACAICKTLFKTSTSAKLHYRKYHPAETPINKM